MGRFDGKTVLITGAARGQGASHARGFANEGAKVVLADTRKEGGRALAVIAVRSHLVVSMALSIDGELRS